MKSWSVPILLGLAAFTGACGSSDRVRYKMVVKVETPQGVRTGFAVREVVRETPAPLPSIAESRTQYRLRGEAVPVDLPNGQTLFALLRSNDDGPDHAGRDIFQSIKLAGDGPFALWPNAPAVVERSPSGAIGRRIPMLVRFRDIEDPTTVERVDPANLEASFEPGFRLTTITVEASDEPVTEETEKRVRWLPNQQGALLRIPIAEYPPRGTSLPLAANITESDFSKGIRK
jgi:hypothetical protein